MVRLRPSPSPTQAVGYTSDPTVSFSGGNPTTPATATAARTGGPVIAVNLVLPNLGGAGYTAAPSVVFTGGGGSGAAATAFLTNTEALLPKTIQELFTLDYGRMNATLGVELPFTNFLIQTTIPYGYIDPPTELFKDGDTQLWKITHNGVDTHFIHFHLFTVQVVNRVGWDGAIKPPDPNELSWKDTVRMNPLEDILVALRPMKQTPLPWPVPNSVRPLDVTMPLGTTAQFTAVDPNNNPAPVSNAMTNFGWEYVWHCHILGHEENDMMRAMSLAVPPSAPATLTATVPFGQRRVNLGWTNTANNQTGFTIQRATNTAFTVGLRSFTIAPNLSAYTDTTVAARTTYYYRMLASNVVGYNTTPGYPTVSADSGYSNTASATTR